MEWQSDRTYRAWAKVPGGYLLIIQSSLGADWRFYISSKPPIHAEAYIGGAGPGDMDEVKAYAEKEYRKMLFRQYRLFRKFQLAIEECEDGRT